ncbi:MAG: hypothetical protein GX761_03945 [Gammaproteobacteria bacterium]|nr:hypothetical protein [Gammaproteobacteria bacterium]
MARERDVDAKVLSAGLAIACHVALGWWLLRPAAVPAIPAAAAPVLQVTWIERTVSERALRVPPPDSPAITAAATLLQQGLEWASTQHGQPDFRPDPLRGPRREPRAAERFAMRDPVAPADVARAIGTLVGGPGYETSPCPRIRRNLAALGPAGDSELMREEIRRLQSLCM